MRNNSYNWLTLDNGGSKYIKVDKGGRAGCEMVLGLRRKLFFRFMERASVNPTEYLRINAAPGGKFFTEKFPLTLAGGHSRFL
jgi:hypothetical protein